MHIFRIVLHGRHKYGTPPEDEELSALLMYLGSSILATLMSIFGKLCSAAGVHYLQLTAVRSSVLCLLIGPVLFKHRVNPFAITETYVQTAVPATAGGAGSPKAD